MANSKLTAVRVKYLYKSLREKTAEMHKNEGLTKFMNEVSDEYKDDNEDIVLPYNVLEKKSRSMGIG